VRSWWWRWRRRPRLAEIATRHLQSLTRQLERASRSARSDMEGMEAVAIVYVRWASRHPERFKLTFGRLGVDDPDLAAAATSARVAFFRPFAHAERHGTLPIDAERASLLAWTVPIQAKASRKRRPMAWPPRNRCWCRAAGDHGARSPT
jgi:Tetracyclin repressor-like, C-terminal domain